MTTFSPESLEILAALGERRNVLISGPPAAGKSRLLNEVAQAFLGGAATPLSPKTPVLDPIGAVPIPAKAPTATADAALQAVLPSPGRTDRKVFRTVFHQNSKHREFLSGLTPSIQQVGGFEVTKGILYRASEHALTMNGASLLIIDEINRGPAVQIFGGAIVAIEAEKRLAPNGVPQIATQYFEMLDPNSGRMIEYAFPHHLYILGAMNQADVSVEPLDVAFLRRWTPYALRPDEAVLRTYFGLPAKAQDIAAQPTTAGEVYEALVQAWAKVNAGIALGRGREFQMGHGVVMTPSGTAPVALGDALDLAARSWNIVRAHIDEVFFGDLNGLAVILKANGSISGSPYQLEDAFFGDEPKQELKGPLSADAQTVYAILVAVAA